MNNIESIQEKYLSEPDFVYSSHIKRIAAFLVDHIIICIFIVLLGNALSEKIIIYFFTERYVFSFVILIMFFIVEAYFFIFEKYNKGKTPGKWLLDIRVVNYNLEQPDFYSLLIRNSARCLYLIPPFFFLPDLICFLVTPGKRIGDVMAKTTVIKN